MTFKESDPMGGLTRKIVETVLSFRDDGLDMIKTDRPETHEIYIDRTKMMTLSEKERTIKLEEPYMFLPESLRNLVDDLKGIGYRSE